MIYEFRFAWAYFFQLFDSLMLLRMNCSLGIVIPNIAEGSYTRAILYVAIVILVYAINPWQST